MAKGKSLQSSEASPEILMLAYLCIKGVETLPEKVSILDRFGLADADIAKICNGAIGSVRNARLGAKKAAPEK